MHSKQVFIMVCTLGLVATGFSPSNAHAQQGCAAASAAAAGNEAALQRAITSAQDMANNQESMSSLMDRCLSGIAGVQTGSFPNLSSIFQQIEQRVCSVIVGRINQGVGSINSGISSGSSSLQDIYSEVPGANTAAPSTAAPSVPPQSSQPARASSSILPDFLRRLF